MDSPYFTNYCNFNDCLKCGKYFIANNIRNGLHVPEILLIRFLPLVITSTFVHCSVHAKCRWIINEKTGFVFSGNAHFGSSSLFFTWTLSNVHITKNTLIDNKVCINAAYLCPTSLPCGTTLHSHAWFTTSASVLIPELQRTIQNSVTNKCCMIVSFIKNRMFWQKPVDGIYTYLRNGTVNAPKSW